MSDDSLYEFGRRDITNRIKSNPFTSAKVVSIDTDPKVYHVDQKRGDPDYVMSYSALKVFAQCPHKWIGGYKSEQSKAQSWGSLIDCLVLTPNKFKESFAIKPETYTDEKGNAKPWHASSNTCKQWLKDNADKTYVDAWDVEQSQKAISALRDDLEIAFCIDESDKQVHVEGLYEDDETGLNIMVKGLLDLVPRVESRWADSIVDLKTISDGSPESWVRHLNDFWYHGQSALYLDLYNGAMDQARDTFRHILSESEAPYEVSKRILSQEFIDLGRMQYLEALKLYCRCLKTGIWPSYSTTEITLDGGWQMTSPKSWMVK